jgi:hypothetical protein
LTPCKTQLTPYKNVFVVLTRRITLAASPVAVAVDVAAPAPPSASATTGGTLASLTPAGTTLPSRAATGTLASLAKTAG